MQFHVAETFVSINGEGQRAGEPAVFIRFAGCNLHCGYCDTAWANQGDTVYQCMTEKEITSYVEASGIQNVTLTGGEPLIQEGIGGLIDCLGKIPSVRIEIETNGSVDITPFLQQAVRPAFTLDYKLPSSGMESAMITDHYRYLEKKDTIKFVVSDQEDLERARQIIAEYQLQGKCGLYVSPVFGQIDPARIVEYILAHKLNQVHVQLQLHKWIWSPDRRGV